MICSLHKYEFHPNIKFLQFGKIQPSCFEVKKHRTNVLFTLNQTTLLSVVMNILIKNWDTET